jgi:hypothetical protein
MCQNIRASSKALQVSRLDQELWDKIQELHQRTKYGIYGLPEPHKTVRTGVVLNDSKEIVAFGAIPLLAELVMVVDDSFSTRTRLKAIQLLLDEARAGVRGKLDGLHAFIQDPEFSRILIKHFGFRKCKGEALYLDTD